MSARMDLNISRGDSSRGGISLLFDLFCKLQKGIGQVIWNHTSSEQTIQHETQEGQLFVRWQHENLAQQVQRGMHSKN